MGQAITNDQFRQALADPNYAIGFMIGNNPEDIADNLNNMGFQVSTPDDITNALNELLARGEGQKFTDALSVRMRQDRLTPEQIAIVSQQAAAMTRAAGGSAKSFDLNAAFAALATGTLFYLSSTGTNTVAPTNNAPPPQPKKDNTAWFIAGAVGLVIVVVVAILVMRKK